jgi:hypothetical protein
MVIYLKRESHEILRYVFWYRDSLTRFQVCFLVPLDSSDIAIPAGTSSFLKIKLFLCLIFNFSGLGVSSFCSERISAQRATWAHFVALVRERQRNGVQIELQRNNKYSFDRERPGLILNFW